MTSLEQELDSPGHTTAIGAAHPELIACAAKSPWSRYASEPPAGQLRIASPATLSFAQEFFDSVASDLPGKMMSSGGDEVNIPCWEEDEETQMDLTQRNITIADALNDFVRTVQGVIKAHGKTPFIKSGEQTLSPSRCICDELTTPSSDMVLTHNAPVVNDTVVVCVMLALMYIRIFQPCDIAQSMANLTGRRSSCATKSSIHPSTFKLLLPGMSDRVHCCRNDVLTRDDQDCGAGDWLGDNVLGCVYQVVPTIIPVSSS